LGERPGRNEKRVLALGGLKVGRLGQWMKKQMLPSRYQHAGGSVVGSSGSVAFSFVKLQDDEKIKDG